MVDSARAIFLGGVNLFDCLFILYVLKSLPARCSIRLPIILQIPHRMHRLPSNTSLRRFRLASVLVVVMFLTAPAALGFVVYGFASGEHGWFGVAGAVVILGIGCMGLNFIMSGRLRCPLCMVPPLLNRRCSKHKGAAKILGSHCLSVALSILFKDSFRCPYCGEPTAMQVRERGKR